MYALYPGQRATGKIMLDGEDILRPEVNLSMLRAKHRHGVPEAYARSPCRSTTTSPSACASMKPEQGRHGRRGWRSP